MNEFIRHVLNVDSIQSSPQMRVKKHTHKHTYKTIKDNTRKPRTYFHCGPLVLKIEYGREERKVDVKGKVQLSIQT